MISKVIRKIYLLCKVYKLIIFVNARRGKAVKNSYKPVYIPTEIISKM